MQIAKRSEIDLGRVITLASALQEVSKRGGFSVTEWSAALYLLLGIGLNDKLPEFESPEELGKWIQSISLKVATVLAEEGKGVH